MKILCVEDGSVDLDALEEEPLIDGKVLVYRQGATPPFLLELNDTNAKLEELAEQKQKAIVPKYQVGQTLFRIDFGAIVPFVVNEIYVHIKVDKTISIQYFDYVGLVIEENELFATREEAKQKLTEIKGEKR